MIADRAALLAWLQQWQFWFLELQFIAFVALAWVNLPVLVRALGTPRDRTAAAAISMLALVLAMFVAPRTNRIYYDEHIYQGIAQNMADLHRAQMCNDGQVQSGRLICFRGEYNKEPPGYPYLLSIPFRLFGAGEGSAHAVNAVSTALLSLVVFAIATLLFGEPRAGLFAALSMALIPEHLLWSNTAAAEPTASLFAAVALLAAICHARMPSAASLAWMMAAIVCAVQFRMEIALVVPLAIVTGLMLARHEVWRRRTLAAGLIAIAAGANHVGHLLAVGDHDWGATGARLSIEHLLPNLAVNGPYYLDSGRFPVLLTLLALVGALRQPNRAVLIPLLAFLSFWGVFLFFYAGSYNFGADVRFSLMSNAWLAVLAGRGCFQLAQLSSAGRLGGRASIAAVAALLFVQFTWFLPAVRSIGEEAWAARADVAFAHAVIPKLPKNGIVLTHNPSIFHLNGVNAAQLSLVLSEPDYVANYYTERFAGGVFLHWNAWCGYIDFTQREFCDAALKSFDHEMIAEARERDFRYAFYRLNTAAAIKKVSQ